MNIIQLVTMALRHSGQGYSTIAWIPEMEDSWALPLVMNGYNPETQCSQDRRAMESLDAIGHLADVVGSRSGARHALTVVKVLAVVNPRSSRRFNGSTFNRVGDTDRPTSTPRKISGVAEGTKTDSKTPLTERPKTVQTI